MGQRQRILRKISIKVWDLKVNGWGSQLLPHSSQVMKIWFKFLISLMIFFLHKKMEQSSIFWYLNEYVSFLNVFTNINVNFLSFRRKIIFPMYQKCSHYRYEIVFNFFISEWNISFFIFLRISMIVGFFFVIFRMNITFQKYQKSSHFGYGNWEQSSI